jgi:hypothetical protein
MQSKSAKAPRTIVVKTLLSPDEFLEFDSACTDSDVSHSGMLRELLKGFVARCKNSMPPPAKKEWPGQGQNMAMLATARRAFFGPQMVHQRL